MATVDPHLMSACDVSIDIDATLLTQLERIQKLFIRRLLGVANRSPVALLFSETGMWPVKYRRITLALRYWQYALSLPDNHFPSYAMADSFNLHRPVLIDLTRQWLPGDIDNVVTAVEQSCLLDIESFISESSKALLLHYRSHSRLETRTPAARNSPILSYRAYLNVPIPAHRKALIRLLTSSHTLAVEVLRWAERRRPPVPRSERLCRFCRSEVEDEAHVLLYCNGSRTLEDLRSQFFQTIFHLADRQFRIDLCSAASGYEIIHILLGADKNEIVGALAKYVFDVFRIFSSVPLYCP
ncbi:hypothetical protein ARMSODRAFT_1024997 [Armillaria solidipes]|uniref:Reverse transcriptase zinc-binding domain-containing protein n=1 Tax=Armillaria solidipes TaxID=1076256 RepID=A0A2H3B5D0_9AGAR|nr:hypothetical protein ARMSODRAFT_1024997 [Armillaria solidipes]